MKSAIAVKFNQIAEISIFLFIILISTFLFLNFAGAQTAAPQFLVSWHSKNYSPSWYQGKVFPTKGSSLEVSFELIDNGKIADLSKEKVRWYVNDDLIKNEENGLGLKSVNFSTRDYPGRITEIRIEIFHYKEGDVIGKIIEIPSVRPEIVLASPYPNNEIGVGLSIFKAFPFFFNVKNLDDLSIEWLAMGQRSEGSGNPWQLNLNIDQRAPKGTEIGISVSVKNLLEEMEFAGKNIKLRVK